jgi:hypothetical protein
MACNGPTSILRLVAASTVGQGFVPRGVVGWWQAGPVIGSGVAETLTP